MRRHRRLGAAARLVAVGQAPGGRWRPCELGVRRRHGYVPTWVAGQTLSGRDGKAPGSLRLTTGREFDPRLAQEKKLPRLSHVQSIVGVRPFSRVTGHYVWVGQGFGGFLDLREKIFFLV